MIYLPIKGAQIGQSKEKYNY